MAAGLRLLGALLLAGSALAHVRMAAISVDGGSFVTGAARLPQVCEKQRYHRIHWH